MANVAADKQCIKVSQDGPIRHSAAFWDGMQLVYPLASWF